MATRQKKEGPKAKRAYRRFSPEEIKAVLGELAGGERLSVVCRRHEVTPHSVYSWKKKFGSEINVPNHSARQSNSGATTIDALNSIFSKLQNLSESQRQAVIQVLTAA